MTTTRSRERANTVSHGAGLLLAVAAAPALVSTALRRGSALEVAAASVFAVSTILLYLASTLYHASPPGRLRRILRRLDHAAIYVLIAGSYTPFTLGVLSGAWGWTLFGLVWTLAILGVAAKVGAGVRRPRLSAFLYLGMGWMAIIALLPLIESLPLPGILWIGAGGLAYTAGVPFYLSRRLHHGHLIWHLFVLAGTMCHYVAVWAYAV